MKTKLDTSKFQITNIEKFANQKIENWLNTFGTQYDLNHVQIINLSIALNKYLFEKSKLNTKGNSYFYYKADLDSLSNQFFEITKKDLPRKLFV
jgi:hypothetical protein